MRFALGFGLFLAVFAVSCRRGAPPRERLVGSWLREIDEPGRKQNETMTFEGNGSCQRTLDTVYHLDEDAAAKLGKRELPTHTSYECHWQIQGDKLVRSYESPSPYSVSQAFQLEGNELRIAASPSNVETFKKK